MLNETALKAAAKASADSVRKLCGGYPFKGADDDPLAPRNLPMLRAQTEAAITAYINSLPTDTNGLVERLNSHMGKQDVAILLADCREAADTITRLSLVLEGQK